MNHVELNEKKNKKLQQKCNKWRKNSNTNQKKSEQNTPHQTNGVGE